MKSKMVVMILALSTIFPVGYLIYLVFFGPESIHVSGSSLSEMAESGNLITLGMIPVILVVVGLTTLPFIRVLWPTEIKNGVQAEARVLKLWDTGTTINDDPMVGFLLEVHPSSQMPFQAEVKQIVSRLQVANLQPDMRADVVFDPQNLKKVKLAKLYIQDTSATAPVDRMEQLEEMHTRHLISEAEYQQKRDEILRTL